MKRSLIIRSDFDASARARKWPGSRRPSVPRGISMGFRLVRRERLGWLGDSRHRSGRTGGLALVLVTAVLGPASWVTAAGPRVLPPDQLPADTRLGPLKGEEGDFSFVPAKSF